MLDGNKIGRLGVVATRHACLEEMKNHALKISDECVEVVMGNFMGKQDIHT